MPNLAQRCLNQKYSFPTLKLALPAHVQLKIYILQVEDVARQIDLQHMSSSSCFSVCAVCQQAGSVPLPRVIASLIYLQHWDSTLSKILSDLRESELEIFSGGEDMQSYD